MAFLQFQSFVDTKVHWHCNTLRADAASAQSAFFPLQLGWLHIDDGGFTRSGSGYTR